MCKAMQGVRISASDCTGKLFIFRMPLDGDDYKDISAETMSALDLEMDKGFKEALVCCSV